MTARSIPDDIDYYENTLAPEIRTGGAEGRPSGMGRRGGGEGRRGGGRRGGGMRGGGFGGTGGENGSGGGTVNPAEPARQGAARYSYFDYPEPITAMDRNFNRGVDRDEMTAAAMDRFKLLDRNGDGALEWKELPHIEARAADMRPRGGFRSPPTPREAEDEPDRN